MNILERLFELKEVQYRDFTAKLVPNVDKEKIIGIRLPILRNFAKDLYKNQNEVAMEFISNPSHYYFDENNLHCLIICEIKDVKICLEEVEKILPYIDNWSTCDLFNPKIFKKHPDLVREKISKWIKSDKIYTVRFAIVMLLSNYLGENFREEDLYTVSLIRSDNYYINMAKAWYFATAMAKQKSSFKIIEDRKLDVWTHNKAIQKAIESRVITKEEKEYLRSLKIK